MSWTERRDPILLLAVALCASLLATIALVPQALWRTPLALLGGLWAPGYALLGAAYPRGGLSRLERHALAACAGLCLLPLLALLASETIGLTSMRTGMVALGATVAFSLVGWAREARTQPEVEPLTRSRLPSTRVTVALCTGALVLAAAVEATSTITARDAPGSLALHSADGPLDLALTQHETVVVFATARAGATPAEGELEVLWNGEARSSELLHLAAGQTRTIEITIHTDVRGSHDLVVRWRGLETDATFVVGGE